jgi:hypothetical protein
VTYEITAMGEGSKLVVTHSDLNEEGMRAGVSAGWPLVLSSLKSFLESARAWPRSTGGSRSWPDPVTESCVI